MTEAFHVGKMRKEWPAAAVLSDKAWARLFDYGNDYQAVIVEFIAAGAEFPIAGMGLNCSLRTRKTVIAADTDRDPETAEYNAQMLALTLRKMRDRKVHDVAPGQTVHLYNWTINHPDGFRYLDTSTDDMKLRLDRLAVECRPLQAWHGQATWIPVFDRAEAYESTVYEDMSALNFFRGILHELSLGLKDQRMTAQWCRNVLRMVTPHMWLCRDLVEQLDMGVLQRVAVVSEISGSTKITKRADCPMDDFELALLPILPIESARVTVLR
jgi:hypothetical protein